MTKMQPETFALSPLQMMYLAGSRQDVHAPSPTSGAPTLGGVSCHGYMEFSSSSIDEGRLEEAWRRLLKRHPALSAAYRQDGTGTFLPAPYSAKIPCIDLRRQSPQRRATSLARIREKLERRTSLVEKGQNAGLCLIRYDGLNTLLAFDMNLACCDVAGLHHLLSELHDLYANPCAVPKTDDAACAERERRAICSRTFAPSPVDTRFWQERIADIARVSADDRGKRLSDIDPEELEKRCYESLDFTLSATEAEPLARRARALNVSAYAAVLAIAACTLAEWKSSSGVVLSIPFFRTPHPAVLGDFTDLGLAHLRACPCTTSRVVVPDELISQAAQAVDEARDRAANNVATVQRSMAAHGIAPDAVFTMLPGLPFIGGTERPHLGRLTYARSQTPQVGLDIQLIESSGGFIVHWVAPRGLFDEYELQERFEQFCESCLAAGKDLSL